MIPWHETSASTSNVSATWRDDDDGHDTTEPTLGVREPRRPRPPTLSPGDELEPPPPQTEDAGRGLVRAER